MSRSKLQPRNRKFSENVQWNMNHITSRKMGTDANRLQTTLSMRSERFSPGFLEPFVTEAFTTSAMKAYRASALAVSLSWDNGSAASCWMTIGPL